MLHQVNVSVPGSDVSYVTIVKDLTICLECHLMSHSDIPYHGIEIIGTIAAKKIVYNSHIEEQPFLLSMELQICI